MDYTEICSRIQVIKQEIHELAHQPVQDIQEKIENLKLINILLREQNQLLATRQLLINSQKQLILAA